MENSTVMNVVNRLKTLFVPLVLVFVGYFAWQSRGLLLHLATDANYLFLSLSVLVSMVTHCISPAFTVLVMREFSNSLTYKEAFMIHAGRLPARYLPGGIWHTVAKAVGYRGKDISPADIGYYLLLEHLIAVCVTLCIGGAIVAANTTISDYRIDFVIGVAIMSGVSLVMLPKLLVMVKIHTQQAISYKSYLHAVVLSVTFWLFAATSFVLFINAFDSVIGDYSMIGAGGVYIFSWGVGFVAIFAPQGIGVTEFVSATLLRPEIPPEIPLSSFIVLLAGFRVTIFLSDMATWCISYKFRS